MVMAAAGVPVHRQNSQCRQIRQNRKNPPSPTAHSADTKQDGICLPPNLPTQVPLVSPTLEAN